MTRLPHPRLGGGSPARRTLPLAAGALLLWAAAGCANRVQFTNGEPCVLTTDCAPPLVCRLERCRVQCRSTRDCAAGLACVNDPNGLGVCQVQEDLGCIQDSDCPATLVCRNTQCVNACMSDRDCPTGQQCTMSSTGAYGCTDPPSTPCLRNSDCTYPLICAIDHQCRVQCLDSRDCIDGTVCGTISGVAACVPPSDGGLSDGGTTDGGP